MRPHRLLTSAAATFLLAGFALAQTTPASTASPASAPEAPKEKVLQLDVFEVTTSKDIGYLSPNAAEATRMNTPIENIPMNITVFNQQFIEDLLATDSSEVLDYDAASVKRTENDGFLSRGTSSVGTNFLNGFAQTAGFGSQPLANIERVEVLRGPAAVLFGAGGYGGTYNRITKRARPDAFVKFRTILSDHLGYRHELDYNPGTIPGLGNKLLFRINGVYNRTTTWFGTPKLEDAIAPTLTWNIGRKTSLTLEYIHNVTETQAGWETPMANGDPHGFTFGDGTYHLTPRKTNWVDPSDVRRNTRTSTSADFRHAFTNNLQFRAQFQYETRDQFLQETVANGTTLTILKDTALTGRYWRDDLRLTRTYRTRNELVWTGDTGPIAHRLLVGFAFDEQYDRDIKHQSAQPSTAINGTFADVTYAQFLANPMLANYNSTLWLMPVNLFDRGAEPPVPDINHRNALPLTAFTRTHGNSTEFYANDVFSFFHDRFYVMAGARKSHFERYSQNLRSGSTILTSYPTVYAEADATTHSIGAVWHLTADKRYSLYVNLNNSFAPDYGVNPDGTGLDPATGDQKEVGLKFSLLGGRIQGNVDYFEIVANTNVNDPDRLGYKIRQDGAHSDGYELNANTNLTKQWFLMSGFSITESYTSDGSVSKLALQPKYRFTMFTSYKFDQGKLKGLSTNLGAVYTGERQLTSSTARGQTNWGPAPAWWRVDAILGYRFRLPKSRLAWNASLKITNLLDEQDGYYVLAYHRYTVNAGRTWQAVVGVRF